MPSFKTRLLKHDVQFGLFCVFTSSEVADALTDSKFDYLIFDTEHGPSSLPILRSQVLALAGTSTHAIVRVPANDPVLFKPVLDLGVDTLMVPNVRTAEEAEAAVLAMRYAPAGTRGIGGSVRATRYGRNAGYYKEATDRLCLLLQIESVEGLANIEKICAVEGVDGIFFGPADLAAEMGLLGQPGHADVIGATLEGLRRVHAVGKAAGIVTSEAHARTYIEAGACIVCFGSEIGWLTRTLDALAERWRDASSSKETSNC